MNKWCWCCWLFSLSAVAADGLYSARGFGTVDPAMAELPAQAKMLAKRAAQLDAQRQLAEMVKGVQIASGSTVEEYEVKSDIIATRVKTWLRGSFALEEKVEMQDGVWVAEVTLGICMTQESEVCKERDSLEAISHAAGKN